MSWRAEVEATDKDVLLNKLENALDKSRSYLDAKSNELVDQQVQTIKDIAELAGNDRAYKFNAVCAGHHDDKGGISYYEVKFTKGYTG